jgi:hypothetical protein
LALELAVVWPGRRLLLVGRVRGPWPPEPVVPAPAWRVAEVLVQRRRVAGVRGLGALPEWWRPGPELVVQRVPRARP